jgi:hypothetical protein
MSIWTHRKLVKPWVNLYIWKCLMVLARIHLSCRQKRRPETKKQFPGLKPGHKPGERSGVKMDWHRISLHDLELNSDINSFFYIEDGGRNFLRNPIYIFTKLQIIDKRNLTLRILELDPLLCNHTTTVTKRRPENPNKWTTLHGPVALNPQTNYTDWATATCRRNQCQLLRIERCRVFSAANPPLSLISVF